MNRRVIVAAALLGLALPLRGQSAADSLLERLVGEWRMTAQFRGEPVEYGLVATRVLGDRYVELHMTDLAKSAPYEARVFIGADTAPGRVLVHWLDNTGAAFSVPAGSGTARGDTLRFDFAYSDGLFRDTFVYRRATSTWRFLLEKSDGHGGWKMFADFGVKPAPR